MNTQYNHPAAPHWSLRWSSAVVIVALFVIIGGYWWNRDRIWILRGPDGRSVCRVQKGWDAREVFAHCGLRSGRGWQPKVPSGTGVDLRMCSAPGDVYGTKVVLYGCDGKVAAVEHMPAHGFIYP